MKLNRYFVFLISIFCNLFGNDLHELLKDKRIGEKEIVTALIGTDFVNDHFRIEFLNEQDSDGNTPLHLACMRSLLEVVQLLVNIKGINKNVINKKGKKPKDLWRLDKFVLDELDDEVNCDDEDDPELANLIDNCDISDENTPPNEHNTSTNCKNIPPKRKLSYQSSLGSSPNNPKANTNLYNKRPSPTPLCTITESN